MSEPLSLSHRRYKRSLIGLMMIAPAVVWLVLVFALPMIEGVRVSVQESEPQLGRRTLSDRFVGLSHYREILSQIKPGNLYGISVFNTLIWSVAVTSLQFAAGLGFALILANPFPGNRFVRTLLLMPWITPPIVAGLSYRWMFHPEFGILRWWSINLLGSTDTALATCIWAAVWRGYGLFMIILLAGVHGVPRTLYEAASIDGANVFGRFRHITLPALRPLIAVLLLLGFVWNFNSFDIVYIMTRGGPANATQLVPITMYQEGVRYSHYGIATAFGMLALGFNMVLAIVFIIMGPRKEQV